MSDRTLSAALADEVVSVSHDHRRDGLPRELHRRKSGAAPKPPALWTTREAFDGEPVWGGFPKGFVPFACRALHCQPSEVLHVCSGAIPPGAGGTRLDLRRAAAPDVVADGRALPFRDESFSAVLIDPPYTVEYAQDLYGTTYPRPSHLLAEAARVLQRCGRVGIVHFIVPMPPAACRLEIVHGVTTGCGYRIRAFTVFVKAQAELFDRAPASGRTA